MTQESGPLGARHREAEAPDFLVQRAARDAEPPRGRLHFSVLLPQRPFDVPSLHFNERDVAIRLGCRSPLLEPQVTAIEDVALAEEDGPLENVAELPNVAGPRVGPKPLERLG